MDAISKIILAPVVPVVRLGSRQLVEHHHLWKLKARQAVANSWAEFRPFWEEQKALPKYVLHLYLHTICSVSSFSCEANAEYQWRCALKALFLSVSHFSKLCYANLCAVYSHLPRVMI